VLDGHGMAPPEDSGGNQALGDKLQNLLRLKSRSPVKFYKEWKEVVKNSYNYKQDSSVDSQNWDPAFFDVQQTQRRIDEAIKTPPSTHSGTTMMHMLQPGASVESGFMKPAASERLLTRQDPDLHNTFEVKTEHQDPLSKRSGLVCNCCGSPQNLKRCQGCKSVVYCSPTCQKCVS
jgi:hypothetical protein